jgi:F0F1-type ATP synthase delta subunit
MKYSVQNYAKALVVALAEIGPEHQHDALRRFVDLLEKNGDEVHANKIVDAVVRLLRKQAGGREVVLEAARPIADGNLKALKEIFAGPNDTIITKVDRRLMAGVRVLVDGEREFDGSLKRKLDALFAGV